MQLFYLAGLPVAGFFQQKKTSGDIDKDNLPGFSLNSGDWQPEIFAIQVQVMSYGQKTLPIISNSQK